jgi:Ser/Thr protein kinase RdoA (MazF antagonist)
MSVIQSGTTHDLRIDRRRAIVVKRFRSWRRSEPIREWTALTLVAKFAPGLAPAPISADLTGHSPSLTMSWLPGTELGTAPITAAQACALAEALDRLWRAVPVGQDFFSSAATPNPAAFTGQVRSMLAAGPKLGGEPAVVRAHATAVAWLDRWAIDHRSHVTVLGHGDPNMANFPWDGGQIRLVDFEDSAPSDRAFELAILTEHLSAWSDARMDADDIVALFDLTRAEQVRLLDFRRLAALFWLIMLRPGSASSMRNPPGTLERQADRLLGLFS